MMARRRLRAIWLPGLRRIPEGETVDDFWMERIERLERECAGLSRRAAAWRRAVAALGIGLVVIVGGAWRDAPPRQLEAERLVIRGDDGKVYADLGVTKARSGEIFPSLRLFDREGKSRVYIGNGQLSFHDADERPRCSFVQQPDGSMGLGFHDSKGFGQLTVGVGFDGVAGVHLLGPDGKGHNGRDHGGLFVDADGETSLRLFAPGTLPGAGPHERVSLGVTKDGTSRLALRGADFGKGIRATVPPAEGAKLSVDGAAIPR